MKRLKPRHEKLDILIALNKETVDMHRGELKENGVIILDGQALKIDTQELSICRCSSGKTGGRSSSQQDYEQLRCSRGSIGFTGI